MEKPIGLYSLLYIDYYKMTKKLNKLTFRKKLQKYKTSSYFFIVEKPILKTINADGTEWFKITLEKIDDKKSGDRKIRDALKILEERGEKAILVYDKGEDLPKIRIEQLGKKEKENEK